MKQYLGLTAAKALKIAQPTEMADGCIVNTLCLRGTRYQVRRSVVETMTGHADVVIMESVDNRVVLYA